MRIGLTLFAILFAFGISISSCKSNKASKSDDGKADLILSFYSPGNGIDKKMLEKVDYYIETQGLNDHVSRVSWGKEGERDLCFDFADLKGNNMGSIIAELKALVADSERVRVKENEPCRSVK